MNKTVKSTGAPVQWVKNNPHCLAMLYFVFYLIAFFSLEQIHRSDLHIIHCALDDVIPFCEWFIIPYCLWFLVMPGSLIYFMFRDKKAFLDLSFLMFTGMTFCLLVYLVWPNGLNLRVEITQTNWAARLVAALQGFDTPTNVCPSIHVSSTVAVELAVRRSESLGKKGWLKAANFVVTVAICLSTMFLKQHSAVDVALGIALSLLLGWVTWHTNWQAALKKTPLRVLFQQRL